MSQVKITKTSGPGAIPLSPESPPLAEGLPEMPTPAGDAQTGASLLVGAPDSRPDLSLLIGVREQLSRLLAPNQLIDSKAVIAWIRDFQNALGSKLEPLPRDIDLHDPASLARLPPRTIEFLIMQRMTPLYWRALAVPLAAFRTAAREASRGSRPVEELSQSFLTLSAEAANAAHQALLPAERKVFDALFARIAPNRERTIPQVLHGGAAGAWVGYINMAQMLPLLLRAQILDPRMALPADERVVTPSSFFDEPFVAEAFGFISSFAQSHVLAMEGPLAWLGLRAEEGRYPEDILRGKVTPTDLFALENDSKGRTHFHLTPSGLTRVVEGLGQQVDDHGKRWAVRHGCPALQSAGPGKPSMVEELRVVADEVARRHLWPPTERQLLRAILQRLG